ncbi:MAG: cytochrome c [Desulfobacteraceae bacterium]|jgi:mono/diheme cytochrome c family protein|nr:cytochrome c [Desulfobacteraceae bacterium]
MKRYLLAGAVLGVVGLTAYIALTLYDLHFPLGRMWETPSVRPYEQPLPLMPAGVVPFNGGEALYRSRPGDQLAAPFDLHDPETVAAGVNGYQLFCAQCHGRHHDGNGTVGQSFAPLPADLRSRRVQALEAGTIFKEISYGFPGGRQPPLATTIPVQQRWQIVAYVQSLGVNDP